MKTQYVSYKVDEGVKNQIIQTYQNYQLPNDGEYIIFFAKKDDLTITIYESGTSFSVLFSGSDPLEKAKQFNKDAELKTPKEKIETNWIDLNDQIGSDEVGVGDFLLPMIVVASFVSKEDIPFLKSLGVDDSKKMKDEKILEIAPILINKFVISKLTLHNEKYNLVISKKNNLNALKAKMHNKALLNVHKKTNAKNIFIDEFCKEQTYFKYLIEEQEVLKNIVFKTKGESFYPSIALSSVIARYCFLKEKENLETKYGMEFPLGASKKVNDFSVEFIKKFGKEEFDKIAKKDFANYEKIMELI